MEVTFSINFDTNKNSKEQKAKVNSYCSCNNESSLEKWLDTAQKIVKMIKVK